MSELTKPAHEKKSCHMEYGRLVQVVQTYISASIFRTIVGALKSGLNLLKYIE